MRHLLPLLLVASVCPALLASEASVWRSSQAEDFREGQLEGTRLESDGRLRLGHQARKRATAGDAVWSIGRLGETVLLGTGNAGELLAMGPKDANAKLLHETGALLVTSIVTLGEAAYACTVPDGRIHQIRRQDGKLTVRTFAKLPDPYPWAMIAHKGQLLVATGPHGIVFRVDAKGAVTVYHDSGSGNILALAAGEPGVVYAGSDRGAIWRIADAAKGEAEARVIAHVGKAEVRALAYRAASKHQPAALYAAANEAAKLDRTPLVRSLAEAIEAQRRGDRTVDRKGILEGLFAGKVIRLDPADGSHETLHALEKNFVSALAVAERGVYVATGTKGRVLHLGDDRRWAVVAEVQAGQTLCLDVDAAGALKGFGSGATGAYWTLARTPLDKASYTSPVHDAGHVARWGQARWDGHGELSIETRSGMTPKPDSGWSAWAALAEGAVASPAARFLQYRLRWTRVDAELTGIRVTYRVRNRRPVITAFGAEPKGDDDDRGRLRRPKATAFKLSWTIEDPDGDVSDLALAFRPIGSERWIPIDADGLDSSKSSFEWDTGAIPDGRYELRLSCDDSGSNGPAEAGADSRLSRPILIDHTPPAIGTMIQAGNKLAFKVSDQTSPVVRVRFRLREGRWRSATAVDGILDETSEEVRLELDGPDEGRYHLELEVTDAAGNVGRKRMFLVVKR